MHPLMHLKLTTPALHASREIEGILAKEKEGQTATQVTEDRRLLFPHRKYKRTTLIGTARVFKHHTVTVNRTLAHARYRPVDCLTS